MRAQSTVVGFLVITAIAIVIAGTTFFWARPLLEKAINQDEVFRIENRLLETHAAIKRVANTQSQTSINFPINKGTLVLAPNDTILFKALFELPRPYKNVILLGNGTYEIGTLGIDEPAFILEQGSYEARLRYRTLNDSANGNCFGIKLKPGAQFAAGPGDHTLFLKWLRENRTATITGCNNVTLQEVQFEIV